MLAETCGVGPFQAGGGGGGGGAGCSATTQVSDAGSYMVPWPQSAALPTAGDTSVTNASGAATTVPMIVERRIRTIIAGFPFKVLPDPARAEILRPIGNRLHQI